MIHEIESCRLLRLEEACRTYGGEFYSPEGWTIENGQENHLFISHELTLTGAPIALLHFAETLLALGKKVVLLSVSDGPLKDEFLKNGIPVITIPNQNLGDMAEDVFDLFESVIVNTFCLSGVISKLNGKSVPVLWWIHEAKNSYLKSHLALAPVKLLSNISVLAAGPLARKHLLSYRPDYFASDFLYCLSDVPERPVSIQFIPTAAENKIIFATIGTVEARKGQDILLDAIHCLEKDIFQKCYFIFVGQPCSDEIMAQLQKECEKYPDHIQYIPYIEYTKMSEFYQQIDCEICASRDDPMPVVITEALRARKLVICSQNTGFATLLHKHHAGMIYENNDSRELALRITEVVCNSVRCPEQIRQNGRTVFEQYFAESIFYENVKKILNGQKKKTDHFLALSEKLYGMEKAFISCYEEKKRYSDKICKSEQEIKLLKISLSDKQTELNTCQSELKTYQERVFTMENAFFWKITKPVRKVLDLIKMWNQH